MEVERLQIKNVTYPVTGPLSRRKKGRPTDQKGPSFRKDALESKIRRFPTHKSKQVVHIKFYMSPLVSNIRRDCFGRECFETCNSGKLGGTSPHGTIELTIMDCVGWVSGVHTSFLAGTNLSLYGIGRR